MLSGGLLFFTVFALHEKGTEKPGDRTEGLPANTRFQ